MSKAIISMISHDRPGLVRDLTKAINEMQLNIEDSRMAVLGGEFAVLMAIAGEQAALQQLDQRLQTKYAVEDVTYGFRPAPDAAPATQATVCRVELSALDHPGIVHTVAAFFSARQINIRDLRTTSEHAPHTGTRVFRLALAIEVPDGTTIGALAAEFADFCADRDLDGELNAVASTRHAGELPPD